MNKYFKGHYFKHQKDDFVFNVIIGRNHRGSFTQIITNDFSTIIMNTDGVKVCDDYLSLDIKTQKGDIKGKIWYADKTKIKSHIMGPLRFLPLECYHHIDSLKHKLYGKISINNVEYDFTNGIGYIEGDYGTSFPKEYFWVQANDFKDDTSIFLAVADVPFLKMSFQGCIAVVHYKGKEYRFATYLGAKIQRANDTEVILSQGKYKLRVKICNKNYSSFVLKAPKEAEMVKLIKEYPVCKAIFLFFIDDELVFDDVSYNASFENLK